MFIIIEGIDGAGCETQGKLVLQKLQEAQKKTHFLKYPHYDDNVGQMIKAFLYDHKELTVEKQFLLYTLQFIFDAGTITEKTKDGIVLADRYFTTTLCYQTLFGFSEEKALRYAEDFGIIKPDFTFFLDVKPETAFKWKQGEEKEKNFMEKDFQLSQNTYKKYTDLIDRQVWTNWVKIDGEREKDVIANDIVQHILTHV